MTDEERYRVAFGRAIAATRVERGVTRSELADLSGVSYPYLAEIERGMKSVTIDKMVVLADTLGVRLSDLMLRAETIRDRYVELD